MSIDGVLFDKKKEKLIGYPIGRKRSKYIVPKGVKEIGDGAFQGASIERVTLPSTLISIGDEAFSSHEGISEIILPPSLLSIGRYAFCHSRIKEIMIPSSVRDIGEGAFYSCSYLKKENISYGLIAVTDDCFMSCNRLEEVILPESIRTIGKRAFSSSPITSIVPPSSLVTIYDGAFYYCRDL